MGPVLKGTAHPGKFLKSYCSPNIYSRPFARFLGNISIELRADNQKAQIQLESGPSLPS